MKYIHGLFILIIFIFLTLSIPLMAQGNSPIQKGKIWDVAAHEYISEKNLIKKLSATSNILLGIQNYNPHHHKLAARILHKIVREDLKPEIFLTNVGRDKQNVFAIFRHQHTDPSKEYDARGLDMLLDWSNSGQPDWQIVRPVFDMAFLKNLSLHAINYSRFEGDKLNREGLKGLPGDIREILLPLLSHTLTSTQEEQILSSINQSHCNELPPEILRKLSLVQKAREGLFALALSRQSTKSSGARDILITTPEQIRKDIGIPVYLDKLKVQGTTVSLLLAEVSKEPSNQLNNAVDYIWYTVSVPDTTSCSPN